MFSYIEFFIDNSGLISSLNIVLRGGAFRVNEVISKVADGLRLLSQSRMIILQWLPSQVGIFLQDVADNIAKESAGTSGNTLLPCSSREAANSIVRNHIQSEWINRWSTCDSGRRLFNIGFHAPLRNDDCWLLPLNRRRIINRLREDLSQLTNARWIDRTATISCPACGYQFVDEGRTEHLLLQCVALNAPRSALLENHIAEAQERSRRSGRSPVIELLTSSF
jgi:hypothetical protein